MALYIHVPVEYFLLGKDCIFQIKKCYFSFIDFFNYRNLPLLSYFIDTVAYEIHVQWRSTVKPRSLSNLEALVHSPTFYTQSVAAEWGWRWGRVGI